MNIAYLILAHNNPRHLERLIKSLVSANCTVFVHIDRKSCVDDSPIFYVENVIFMENRVAVYWGDFSIVAATLRLLRRALQHGQVFDYYILLSGNDYPLRSAAYVEHFLETNKGKEFINLVPIPNIPAGKPVSRLTQYRHSPSDPIFMKLLRKILLRVGLVSQERDFQSVLRELKPYGGSQWWALSHEACGLVLSFVDNNRKIVDFFRHTVIPDEMFFQTIIGNSSLAEKVARNFTYADWSRGGPNPAVLTRDHLGLIASGSPLILDDVYGRGEALFARKFDDTSEELVCEIDRCRLDNEENRP